MAVVEFERNPSPGCLKPCVVDDQESNLLTRTLLQDSICHDTRSFATGSIDFARMETIKPTSERDNWQVTKSGRLGKLTKHHGREKEREMLYRQFSLAVAFHRASRFQYSPWTYQMDEQKQMEHEVRLFLDSRGQHCASEDEDRTTLSQLPHMQKNTRAGKKRGSERSTVRMMCVKRRGKRLKLRLRP